MSLLYNHHSKPAQGHTNMSLISRLDGSTRYTYQSTATSSFSASAQISTVSVVRAIVAAAAQPAYAKISDYFGRVSILLISSVFYVVGESSSSNTSSQSCFSPLLSYTYVYPSSLLLLLLDHLISDAPTIHIPYTIHNSSCNVLMIGTIVMATGTEVSGFAGGAVLYQFGFTGVQRMSHLHSFYIVQNELT